MKATPYIVIILVVLLMLATLHIRTLTTSLEAEKEHVRQSQQELAQCSVALERAMRTAAVLGEQGKTSQENCASAILAAQSLHMLALPPSSLLSTEQGAAAVGLSAVPTVNSPPDEVNDAAFTHFLNTF